MITVRSAHSGIKKTRDDPRLTPSPPRSYHYVPPHPQPESSSTMFARTTVLLAALATLTVPPPSPRPPVPPSLLSGMVWRNLGPFRGGRISAVSGAIGQPGVSSIGPPLGGLR